MRFSDLADRENADVPPLMTRLATDVLCHQCMIRLSTVTEVQPKHPTPALSSRPIMS